MFSRSTIERAQVGAVWLAPALALFAAIGCGNPIGNEAGGSARGAEAASKPAQEAPGQAVEPPFAVRGELDGLLLVWFDAAGVHTASKRSEIPEASRALVRVDSLAVAPDHRLDADHVYVADVRAPGKDGSYAVQMRERAWFDAQVDKAKPPPTVQASTLGASDVVIYKASWCSVCRSAAKYLREQHVPFVEKDVEKDPAAQAEMLDKAHKKGLTPTGVPVIDFRGEIMLGFDQPRISQLIDRYSKAI
jgi:glutaredoxin